MPAVLLLLLLLCGAIYSKTENLDLVNGRKLNIPFRFRKLANATFVLYGDCLFAAWYAACILVFSDMRSTFECALLFYDAKNDTEFTLKM